MRFLTRMRGGGGFQIKTRKLAIEEALTWVLCQVLPGTVPLFLPKLSQAWYTDYAINR